MDMASGITDQRDAPAAEGRADAGRDRRREFVEEQRMHLRAYEHWLSLCGTRAFPSMKDFDPEKVADFAPRSVLLHFANGLGNPQIRYLGAALREECGIEPVITHVGQVPGRSLLSRLTAHCLEIIANRAPIGFEAEFIGSRGNNTLYRGILMPLSSDGETIDFIHGVINWKEQVDAGAQEKLEAEIADAWRAPFGGRRRPALTTARREKKGGARP